MGVASLLKIRGLNRWSGILASFMMGLSFLQAIPLVKAHLTHPGHEGTVASLGSWITVGSFSIDAALHMDTLAAVMALVVIGVSLLIHIYSIGYMASDPNRGRYFAYLNLFCGFMLLLVTASSLPLLFVGWEGVGLCSYLLIGFWFEDVEKARAGKKAFVVNRIGDAGFLMAMFLAFYLFGSLEFSEMAGHSGLSQLAGSRGIELLAILIFVGCVGKSAQFPLYLWLPDAMAGPTPVSALIHAATMVTAGIYVIARTSFLFELAPGASEAVAVIGAFTAFFAGMIAIAQRDIKKVLAFSTVSQLGFMVLAMGVGAYAAGMFHLVTHAYFKALLFMAAGSVIHALHGEQDLAKMGGLKTHLVRTTLVFLFGYAAIVGLPPFSGWFSKDQILYGVYASGHRVLFWIALVSALLTAIYMTRLLCMVFWGILRNANIRLKDIHESPRSMMWPMITLAFLSLVGGIPFFAFPQAVTSLFSKVHHGEGGLSEHQLAWLITLLVIAAIVLTFRFYTRSERKLKAWGDRTRKVRAILENQFYWDEMAVGLTDRVSVWMAEILRLIDVHVIDGAVNRIATASEQFGRRVAQLQTGLVTTYASFLLVGLICLVWLLLGGVL